VLVYQGFLSDVILPFGRHRARRLPAELTHRFYIESITQTDSKSL
jgi:hypothetical protein